MDWVFEDVESLRQLEDVFEEEEKIMVRKMEGKPTS